ncbi:MAG TPA: LacI family DNA-binding transcriptional regulator [Steroidobacteraceae bacterium]|nr:LacI family DNA-binding transcriptional regulator [Steroidobacteraceae bacterium]
MTRDSKRRLQMADIARMAGVSVSTVSRALSGSALVNQETRTRVADLARSLNYTVNVGAQNLRLQQNRTVGVVVPYEAATGQHVSDPFFLRMLGALADALTARGFDMLFSRVSAEHLDAAGQLHDTGRAAGVILIGQWRHHEQLNELASRRVPLVVWGAQLPQQLYCTVGGDNLAGGRLATRHLLQRGRRRIAFYGDTELPEVALRYQGYLQALREAGVALDPALVKQVPFVPEKSRSVTRGLLTDGVPFDAIFATSDVLALMAQSTLLEAGRRVPEEIAVVGYDDIEMAAYAHPALTTVRQPIEAGANALVHALLEVLQGRRSEPVMLVTELVVRASG